VFSHIFVGLKITVLLKTVHSSARSMKGRISTSKVEVRCSVCSRLRVLDIFAGSSIVFHANASAHF